MLNKLIIDDKELYYDHIQNEFTFEYEFYHSKYKIWFKKKGESPSGLLELQVNFSIETVDGAGGKVTAIFGAKGLLRIPHQSAEIKIENNSLTKFETNNKVLLCNLTLEYVCQFSPGGGTTTIEFPNLTMKIPVQALTSLPIPIPIYINIGLGFNTYLNLPSLTSWASAKVNMQYNSQSGFKITGPSVELGAKVNNQEIGDVIWEVGDMSLAPVGVEVRHDVFVPRIAIEMIGQEIAWFSGVMSSRSKLIVPSLCKAQLAQIRIDGGVRLSLFNLDLYDKSEVIWETSRMIKTKECP